MLEIVFLCTLNMLNFERLALIATEMKQMKWNKEMKQNIFDWYLHLTKYILVL